MKIVLGDLFDGEKMIKAVIFDLWETIVPTTIDFVHLKSLTEKNGLPVEEFVERYERSAQLGKFDSLETLRAGFLKAFPGMDEEFLESAFYEVWANRFDKVYFYPEAEKTLLKLRSEGYKVVLLSNTESFKAKEVEKKLNFRKYFDSIFYSFEIGAVKPDKAAFNAVLNGLKLKPEECLMVGDSLRSDIFGANSVGMRTCRIVRSLSRVRNEHFGVKPDYVIGSLDEIFKILGELNKK